MSSTAWNWIIAIVGGLLVAVATPKLIEVVYGTSNQPPLSKALPPETTGQAAKAEPATPELDREAVAEYIEWEYLRDREKYAQTVDYYDKGFVSREFVAKDKADYAERWPQRRYILSPGSLHSRRDGDRIVVIFNYTYTAVNGAKRVEGTGRTKVILGKLSGEFVVEGVKEVTSAER